MPKEETYLVEEERIEKAVLVGLITRKQNEKQLHEYLDELAFLAETAGAQTEEKFWQRLDHPEKRT
jgi:GTP-binding protein HflX